MELISKKQIVKNIREYMQKNKDSPARASACRSILSIIRDQVQTPVYGEWIPCEESMPEDFVNVLVWYEYFRYGSYNRMFRTYGIARRCEGNWLGDVTGTNAKCIAWMPLPKPYRKRRSNESNESR